MNIITALNNIATYNVGIICRDMHTLDPSHKEDIPFRSLLAAKEFAATVADCVDVCHVDVVDTATGEVMWYKSENGETYEAAT